MDRRDFLKMIFLLIASWTVLKWLRSFERMAENGKTASLREAEFYRRADHLAG